MGGFFSMDGLFYKFGGMLADIMFLSLLWLVFSLPVVTVGASTTAVYYVATKRVSNREGYVFRDFWSSFKHNFVIATMSFLTLAAVAGILIVNIRNITIIGSMASFIMPLQICFLVELVLIFIYTFPLLSRFDMKFTQLLRSAFFMANRHLLTTVTCLLLLLVALLAVYIMPLAVIIAIGLYAYVTSWFLLRIFKKYRPEIVAEEDIQTLAPLNLDMPLSSDKPENEVSADAENNKENGMNNEI